MLGKFGSIALKGGYYQEQPVPTDNETLISLTADIVSAHVNNNSVAIGDLAPLIQKVFGALQELEAPAAEAPDEKPQPAVSIRASIKPDHLISLIDGKPYRMLKRHLSLHGYTPDGYREAFGLPKSYPMVAASYAEQRRQLAHKIGLGRKPTAKAASPEPAAVKPARKPRAKKDAPAS